MSEAPQPASWPSRFLGACLSILVGSIALSLSVTLLRAIAPYLIGVAVLALVGWVMWTWRRASSGW